MQGGSVRASVAAVIVGALLAFQGQIAVAADPTEPGSGVTVEVTSVDAEITLRQGFGLRATAEAVLAARGDPKVDTTTFGLPLTPAEVVKIQADDRAIERMGPLMDLVGANPDAFGGIWITRDPSPVAHVVVTRDTARWTAKVLTSAPMSATPDLVVRGPAASTAALEFKRDRIVDAYGPELWRISGMIGPDPRTGTVLIRVSDSTAAVVDKIVAEYGDSVTIEQVGGAEFRSCTSRRNCTNPFMGGMSIRPSGYASDYDLCTATMYGRYQTGAIAMITAGHCLKPFSLSTTWFNGANTIGPGLGWSFGPDGDFAAIRVTASDTGPRNRVIRSSPTDWMTIAYEKLPSQQTIGTTVCRSSAVVPVWNCNPINGVDMTKPVCDQNGQNCVSVSHLWSASFTSAGGSSGGPVFYGSTIFGVVSAGDATSTYYTPTFYMTFVHPCLTSTC